MFTTVPHVPIEYAATIRVNPLIVLLMLEDFVKLDKGTFRFIVFVTRFIVFADKYRF